MAASIQTHIIILPITLLILHLLPHPATPAPLFTRQGFNNADLGLDFTLSGDAELDDVTSCVNLTTTHRPHDSAALSSSTAGEFVFKKPLKLTDRKSAQPVSFSTDFVFSISPGGGGDGDGLALVIAPVGDLARLFGAGPFGVVTEKFVAVEYDTRKDDEFHDVSANHVGVDVGGFDSKQVRDLESTGIVLNGGERLRTWVDYEAGSKRLEIRLGKLGSGRPYEPLISHPLDLAEFFGDEILIGITSSSSEGSSQATSSVCSWSLRVRTVPDSLHSQPMDPRTMGGHGEDDGQKKKKNCALKVLGGVIFATGCGTLVAFFMLLLWVVIFSSSFPAEIPMKNLDFRYEKIDVNGGGDELGGGHPMEPKVSV